MKRIIAILRWIVPNAKAQVLAKSAVARAKSAATIAMAVVGALIVTAVGNGHVRRVVVQEAVEDVADLGK